MTNVYDYVYIPKFMYADLSVNEFSGIGGAILSNNYWVYSAFVMKLLEYEERV